MDKLKQVVAAGVVAAAAVGANVGASAQTPPAAPNPDQQTKHQLMERMYGVVEKACGINLRDTFMKLANQVGEADMRKLVKDGVTICPDNRMTSLPAYNLTGNDLHGAFYNMNEYKILALKNDASWNSRTANTVSTFNNHNIAGTTPVGATRFGAEPSTLGSMAGPRETRTDVRWGPETMNGSVAEQVREKSLTTAPLNPAFKPMGL